MINFSQFDNYRDAIKAGCKELGINYKQIAQNTGIHTSYFSRVMVEKADFSPSQLYLIAQSLKLTDWETDFILLLGEYSQTSHHSHQAFIWQKIQQVKKEKQKIIHQIQPKKKLGPQEIDSYYQDLLTAEVHMYLTIKKYRDQPKLVAKKLGISPLKLQEEIAKLAALHLITAEKGVIHILQGRVHLDESHPVSSRNHINHRLQSIQKLLKDTLQPSDYHLSAVFSTDEESKIKIKNMFKEFVVKAQAATHKKSHNLQVFHLNFDLY